MDIVEVQNMFEEFLPWQDSEVEEVTAVLSSIRESGDDVIVVVDFLLNDETVGLVKYKYYPSENHLMPTVFRLGPASGAGVFRRYADDSLEVVLEYIDVCSTLTHNEAIISGFESSGWTQSEDDTSIWSIHPGEFTRTT